MTVKSFMQAKELSVLSSKVLLLFQCFSLMIDKTMQQYVVQPALLFLSILVGICLWHLPPLPVNYASLEAALDSGDFKRADRITRDIIVIRASRQNAIVRGIREMVEPAYFPIDLAQVPCEDLVRVNELWKKYSQGKFGFTAQKSIWDRVYETDIKIKDFDVGGNILRMKMIVLARKVEWFKTEQRYIDDRDYERLDFTLDAPVGHLPSWLWTDEQRRPTPHEEYKYNSLFQRMQSCQF